MTVDWADLAVIDLSKAATVEGRQSFSKMICEAMTTNGFFYVINHGYTPEQVCQHSKPLCTLLTFLYSLQDPEYFLDRIGNF
jgi:isopenicillin N synthase-like dioxygenase